MFANMISQITSRHQVNDQVQIILVFKGVMHVDKESTTETPNKHNKISSKFESSKLLTDGSMCLGTSFHS